MRNTILYCICLVTASTLAARSQTPASQSKPLLVLVERTVALSTNPPRESGSCIAVDSSGYVYEEIRTHLVRDPMGNLKVYTGQLSQTQLSALEFLLDSSELKRLSPESQRRMPMTVSDFSWITAEVQNGSSVQKKDYRYWKVGSQEYNGVDESYVTAQRNTLRVLTPLLSWVNSIDINKLNATSFQEGMCSLSAETN